jgi:SulP family sulfate permease
VVLRLFPSLAGYRRSWLQGDVMAGLTVWAMLIPQALAYASIAGVSPVVGLYATPAALLLYAAFGSSRHLVVGPMSATAALSAAAVAELATQGSGEFAALTATLAITAGIIGVVAGLARLGFVANFISEPVLKGFIIGLALMIMVGQVPKLFGVPKGEGNFFERLWHLLGNLDQTSGLTLLVGLGSLALILGLRRVAPMVPGSLVAVVLGIVVVQLFHADRHGAAIVGSIEPGSPRSGCPAWPPSTTSRSLRPLSGSCWSASPRASARPRPMRPASAMRSTPTASCSAWARPTSAPACPVPWSSAGACPRPPSTAPPAPAPSCRGWSWPP